MKTLRLTINPEDLDSPTSRTALHQASQILRQGGLVAFPTETVYGLGANALNAAAAEKIFAAKQRPAWDPLIVHIADSSMLARLTSLPLSPAAEALAGAFWPGPLTMLLPRAPAVPAVVTAGRLLVGVRLPAHPVARALIAAAGLPIAAPSANSFGRISPTTAAHVLEDLDGRIDAVLDAGETTHGLESTVVDPASDPVTVYRPGIITLDQIRRLCPSAIPWQPPSTRLPPGTPEWLPSPGVGIRHYAPRARLVLIGEGPEKQPAALLNLLEKATPRSRVGVMLPAGFLAESPTSLTAKSLIFDWGDWQDLPELAHRLFAGLRQLDAAGVDQILCPLPPDKGLGAAIRDRLLKAAANLDE